jgi:hypothetical protein
VCGIRINRHTRILLESDGRFSIAPAFVQCRGGWWWVGDIGNSAMQKKGGFKGVSGLRGN